MPGVILLRQIAPHLRMLDVRCRRCTRFGRLSVARLMREMGEDAPVWHAWRDLNAGCPQRDSLGAGKACFLYAPDLPGLRL